MLDFGRISQKRHKKKIGNNIESLPGLKVAASTKIDTLRKIDPITIARPFQTHP